MAAKKLDPMLVMALRRATTSLMREGVREGEKGKFLSAKIFAELAAHLYGLANRASNGTHDATKDKAWIEAHAMKRNAGGHDEAFNAWQEIRKIGEHL